MKVPGGENLLGNHAAGIREARSILSISEKNLGENPRNPPGARNQADARGKRNSCGEAPGSPDPRPRGKVRRAQLILANQIFVLARVQS